MKAVEKVELGFNENASGNFFVLDNATRGVLDNVIYVLGGAVYYDVTQYVKSVTTNRGRSRELDRFNAGSISVIFDNTARIFDPTYTASPFYGQVVPRRDIRFSTNGITQFTGITDDWNLNYSLNGQSESEVIGYDGFALISQQTLTPQTYTSQKSGARITAILNDANVNWSFSNRAIDVGQETLQGDTVANNTNVVSYINTIEKTELGEFYFDKKNFATWHDRSSQISSAGVWASAGVRTNLTLNPSMELASGTTTVRTNLATNPYASSGWTNQTPSGGTTSYLPTGSQDGGYAYQVITTTAGQLRMAFPNSGFSVAIGDQVALSVDLYSPVATTAQLEIGINPSTYLQSTPQNIVVGWNRLSGVITATVAGSIGLTQILTPASISAGTTWIASRALIEKSSIVQSFFDGSHQPALRTNLAIDPRATVNQTTAGKFWWQPRWYGTGGAGNTTLVTGATDSPIAGVSTYMRKTWTVVPTLSQDIAFSHSQNGVNGYAVTAGQTFTISGWYRHSWDDTSGGFTYVSRQTVAWYDSSGTLLSYSNGTNTAKYGANVWYQVSNTFTVPTGATYAEFYYEYYSATMPSVGSTIDGTGLLVEQTSTVGSYFDGSNRPALRTNLLTNPSFETGITGYSSAQTVVQSSAFAFSGTSSASIAVTNSADSNIIYTAPTVTVGTYTYSIYFYIPSGSTLSGRQISISLEGTVTGITINASNPATLAVGSWARASVIFTTTASSPTFVTLVNRLSGTMSTAIGQTIYADAVLLEQASTIGTYFNGYKAAADGSSYAWLGTANASQSYSYATAVGVGWRGTSDASQSYSYDTDLSIAWSGTANASTSLQQAPSLYYGDVSAYFYATIYQITGGLNGNKAAAVKIYNTATLTPNGIIIMANNTNIAANTNVVCSMYLKGPAGVKGVLGGRANDTSGAYLAESMNSQIITFTGDWQRVSVSFTMSVAFRAGIQFYVTNTEISGTGFFYVDSVLIEQTSTLGTYFDGSSITTGNSDVYAWTGTPNNSTSTDTQSTFVAVPSFTDDNTGIPYSNVKVVYGSELLFNKVIYSRLGGGTSTAFDTPSITSYGTRVLTENGLLHTSDLATATLAAYVVTQYRYPEYRFEAVEVELYRLSLSDQQLVLALEIGNVAKIVYSPNRLPPAIVKYAEIVGISNSVGISSHKITFKFRTLDYGTFVLDDAVFGVIDYNVLGY